MKYFVCMHFEIAILNIFIEDDIFRPVKSPFFPYVLSHEVSKLTLNSILICEGPDFE